MGWFNARNEAMSSPWFPLQFVLSRYIHLDYLYLNFRKLQQALLVENSLTSKHFLTYSGIPSMDEYFSLSTPTHWHPCFSIPEAMLWTAHGRCLSVSFFFPFPFGPIPCRSCAKRRTTDDEKGGILFFLEVKLGYPKHDGFLEGPSTSY